MAITKKQKVILLFCCTSISIYKLGTGNSHKPEGEIYHSARLEPFFFYSVTVTIYIFPM